MTFDVWWLAYIVLGACTGILAGMLGVGGGSVMVPILTTLFVAQSVPDASAVHLALGTSMASIILTSIMNARSQHKRQAVDWNVLKLMTPGIVVGTITGSFVASRVPSMPLAIFFTCVMGYVAFSMVVNTKPKPSRSLPPAGGMMLVGLLIGGISSLIAIGGGAMTVPFLLWCNVDARRAIGTSAAVGIPISLAGTIGYAINGLHATDVMPPYSLGFVYLPAFILLSVASILSVPLGVALAWRLPVVVLKRIFAVVLILLCVKMIQSLM